MQDNPPPFREFSIMARKVTIGIGRRGSALTLKFALTRQYVYIITVSFMVSYIDLCYSPAIILQHNRVQRRWTLADKSNRTKKRKRRPTELDGGGHARFLTGTFWTIIVNYRANIAFSTSSQMRIYFNRFDDSKSSFLTLITSVQHRSRYARELRNRETLYKIIGPN